MQNTVNDYTKELNQLKSAIEKAKTEVFRQREE